MPWLSEAMKEDVYKRQILYKLIKRKPLQLQRRGRRLLYRNNRGCVVRLYIPQRRVRGAHKVPRIAYRLFYQLQYLARHVRRTEIARNRVVWIALYANRFSYLVRPFPDFRPVKKQLRKRHPLLVLHCHGP